MKRYQIHLLAATAGALLLAFISACNDGPRGPAGAPVEVLPGVSGTIEVHAYDEVTVNAEVAVDEAPSVPGVLLNGLSTPLPVEFSEGVHRFFFSDLPFQPGDSVHLSVNYSQEDGSPAEAFGDIVIPDTFQIVQPDSIQYVSPGYEVYDLRLGDSLKVAWSASSGTRAYSIWFYLQYAYLDTAQAEQYFYLHVDTLMTDTSMIFTPMELFPDLAQMNSVLSSGGSFHVTAIGGPTLPGDLGNIGGDGQGFFTARSEEEGFSINLQP